MQFETLNINNDIAISYSIQKTKSSSKVLIVSFPGAGGGVYDELGYLFTLKKYDCNAIFFKADQNIIKSMFCFYNKTTIVEESIYKFIKETSDSLGCSQIIVIGSSLGGYCSLYYGLKYNWDIISGSPLTFTEERKFVEYCAGSTLDTDKSWLNAQLSNVITKNSGIYNKFLFISFGEGENNYLDPNKGQNCIKLLNDAHINYFLKLFPFSDHNSIHRLFPTVLDVVLPQILNKKETGKISILDNLFGDNDVCKLGDLSKRLNNISEEINNCNNELSCNVMKVPPELHYIKNLNDELRDYCYISSGYFYDPKEKKGLCLYDKGGFWSIESNTVDEYMGFQSCILDLYYKIKDKKIFDWLCDNLDEYLSVFKYYKKKKPGLSSIDLYLTRVYYLFNILNLSYEYSHPVFLKKKIIIQIIRNDIISLLNLPIVNIVNGPYKILRAVICFVSYTSLSNCNNIIDKLLDLLVEFNTIYFNYDGLCVKDLSDMESISTELHKLLSFIQNNNLNFPKLTKYLQSFINKIDTFNCHLVLPNNCLLPLGHTISKTTLLPEFVDRKVSNYIKPSSDLAILENDLSYISVGTGNPYKSNHRHDDLMSFSWFYNGMSVFLDGGSSPSPEIYKYISSSFAHNTIFCSDKNYTIPSYLDFTTIKSYEDREEYVLINMEHVLINNSKFCRKFIWIKPNIIILIDNVNSKNNHTVVQNFLLNNFKYKIINDNSIDISLSSDSVLHFRQYNFNESLHALLSIKNGSASDDSYLGNYVDSSGKKLLPGLNIQYTKNTDKCLFITSLQIKTNNEKISTYEKDINSITTDNSSLKIKICGDDYIFSL